MNDLPKAAAIVGAAIIIAVAISVYFSPFQTCVRGAVDATTKGKASHAAVICATKMGR